MEISLLQLCKAIWWVSEYLPDGVRNDIIRTHEKTWTLVVLTTERLCNPTPAARARLTDLYRVLDKTREERMLAAIRSRDNTTH